MKVPGEILLLIRKLQQVYIVPIYILEFQSHVLTNYIDYTIPATTIHSWFILYVIIALNFVHKNIQYISIILTMDNFL